MPQSQWIEVPTRHTGTILLNMNQVISIRAGTGMAVFVLADGNELDCALSFKDVRRMLVERETPAGTFG